MWPPSQLDFIEATQSTIFDGFYQTDTIECKVSIGNTRTETQRKRHWLVFWGSFCNKSSSIMIEDAVESSLSYDSKGMDSWKTSRTNSGMHLPFFGGQKNFDIYSGHNDQRNVKRHRRGEDHEAFLGG